MTRRAARIVLLFVLLGCVFYEVVPRMRALISNGAPRLLVRQLPANTTWADLLAVVEMDFGGYLRDFISLAALAAVLPRPRLYKLILLTGTFIGVDVAENVNDVYMNGRGVIPMSDGSALMRGGDWGPPLSLGALVLDYLERAKAILLAWTLWFLQPRPPRPGHCPRCDYSLTGAVSDRCPECGTPRPAG